jgi:hypothetical protein
MPARTWRVKVRVKTWLAVATAISLLAVACDGGADRGEAPGTSSDKDFLDPIANGQDIRDLFVVEADDGEYWRFFTLDTYDGESWSSADPGGSGGVPLSPPALLSRSDEGAPLRGTTLMQTFRILGDVRFGSASALPTAQTAERITGAIGDITWDPSTGVASPKGDLEAGMTYTVRSRIVVPTPGELDRIDLAATLIDGRWTALPDLDPRIAEIAKEWTAGATTAYRKVLAIQQRFQRDDFVYSTAVDTTVSADALVEFLTRTKAGFCVHYSSAMALMVRSLGLPSRIGVGFRAGTLQANGSYLVTTNDAHVWVEVLFPGYGWLQFEPEHGTAHPNAQPGTYLNP